jgi:hypothetical protein
MLDPHFSFELVRDFGQKEPKIELLTRLAERLAVPAADVRRTGFAGFFSSVSKICAEIECISLGPQGRHDPTVLPKPDRPRRTGSM